MPQPNLGDKITQYPRTKIEGLVDQFVRQRPWLSELPPVDIDLILLRMKEVATVEAVDVLATEYRTEAMVLSPVFMHRHLEVWIDSETMNKRDPGPCNMAIAEEIGHIELHRAVILQIKSQDEFLELQRHPRWAIAEHDAKYFARALLMPRNMLEVAASDAYRRIAFELGFGNKDQFESMFVTQLAALFEIPRDDADKRIDRYVGNLRGRLSSGIFHCQATLPPVGRSLPLFDATPSEIFLGD